MYVTLQSVQVVTPSCVEIVYWWPGEDTLRGIRLDVSSMESASERIRTSSVDELAFDLVAIGMQEPRRIEEFTHPDENAIRWLPTETWLDP